MSPKRRTRGTGGGSGHDSRPGTPAGPRAAVRRPQIGLYLELFTYLHPRGDQTVHRRRTNDLGGIRHVAVEVLDAVAAYKFIRSQQRSYRERGLRIEILGQDHTPEEITPYPYKFFDWIDPWGVQWEMEQGRPVDRAVTGIVG